MKTGGEAPAEHPQCPTARFSFRKAKACHWDAFSKAIDAMELSPSIDQLCKDITSAAIRTLPRGYLHTMKPAWSAHIEELDRKAAAALTEFRRDECEAKRTAFEALKAERDDEIRKAREALIRERLDSLSPAETGSWHYVRGRLTKSVNSAKAPIVSSTGKTVTKSRAKADALVVYYTRHQRESKKGKAHTFLKAPRVPVRGAPLRPISMLELETAIDSTPNGKAAGADGLHNEVLKRLTPRIKNWMLSLLNESLRTGRVSPMFRSGIIVPVPKPNADPSALKSLRPITLTPVVSKVMETIVLNRIRYRWSPSNNQFAYQAHKSTEDVLTRLTDIVHQSLAEFRLYDMDPKAGGPRKQAYRAIETPCRAIALLVDLSAALTECAQAASASFCARSGATATKRGGSVTSSSEDNAACELRASPGRVVS